VLNTLWVQAKIIGFIDFFNQILKLKANLIKPTTPKPEKKN